MIKFVLANSAVVIFDWTRLVCCRNGQYLSAKHLHLRLHEPCLGAVPFHCYSPTNEEKNFYSYNGPKMEWLDTIAQVQTHHIYHTRFPKNSLKVDEKLG